MQLQNHFINGFLLLDGRTLTLNEPLEYEHLGVTEIVGGRDVEFRGKVLCSVRKIRIYFMMSLRGIPTPDLATLGCFCKTV